MDPTPSSSLSARHTQTVSESTSRQTRQRGQMPPGIGVRPVDVDRALWRNILFAASDMGNIDIARGVLAAGLASPDSSDPETGDSALMHAAQHGQANMVQYLLDARATVDQVRNDCLTALGIASIARQSKVYDVLMRNQAQATSIVGDHRQYTPEQLDHIQRGEQALCDTEGLGRIAPKPGFWPPGASNQ